MYHPVWDHQQCASRSDAQADVDAVVVAFVHAVVADTLLFSHALVSTGLLAMESA